MTSKEIKVFLSCALFIAYGVGTTARGELVFEAVAQRVPAKWSDAVVVGVYKFKNTGNETVKVTELESSCSCTVPKLEKRVYAPGESGELRAEFTVGERVGPQHKVLTVHTDLAAQKDIELIFDTDVPAVPDLQPQMLSWTAGGELAPKTVVVTVPAEVPVDKVEIAPAGTAFAAVLKTVEAGRRYELTVTPLKGAAESAAMDVAVMVRLKDGTTRTRRVQVMVW